MPRYDGTGPMGQGALTGRGLGFCGGGMGYGRGIRRGRRFYTPKEESEVLKDETEILEQELKAIKSRLAQLKGQK